MKVYIDQGVNQKVVKQLQKSKPFVLVQGHSLEQLFTITEKVGEPFRLDHSLLDGSDRLVGDNYSQVESIIGKINSNDVDHLYSAYMDGCDIFLTNNPDDFIRSKRGDANDVLKRAQLEAILNGIKIMTLEEFKSYLKES